MIDMHIHAVHPQLPGVKPLTDLYDGPGDALVAELREQMRRSGTTTLLGMGHLNGGTDDPLGVASTLAIAASLPELRAIGIADPTRVDTDHLQRVEAQLQAGAVIALKATSATSIMGRTAPATDPISSWLRSTTCRSSSTPATTGRGRRRSSMPIRS